MDYSCFAWCVFMVMRWWILPSLLSFFHLALAYDSLLTLLRMKLAMVVILEAMSMGPSFFPR